MAIAASQLQQMIIFRAIMAYLLAFLLLVTISINLKLPLRYAQTRVLTFFVFFPAQFEVLEFNLEKKGLILFIDGELVM